MSFFPRDLTLGAQIHQLQQLSEGIVFEIASCQRVCLKNVAFKKTLWVSLPKFSFARNTQQTRVYPYPLAAGPARPNPKMGAPDPENPLFLGLSGLRGGPRPWSQTMVSEGVRPWGRGRSGDLLETPVSENAGARLVSVQAIPAG